MQRQIMAPTATARLTSGAAADGHGGIGNGLILRATSPLVPITPAPGAGAWSAIAAADFNSDPTTRATAPGKGNFVDTQADAL